MASKKWTRREFLKTTGTTAVGLPIVFALSESFAFELGGLERQKAKPKPLVRAVFVRLPTPWWMGWPGAAYPVERREREISNELRRMANNLGIDLIIEPKFIATAEETNKLVERLKTDQLDALLVVLHHIYLWNLVETLVGSGIKTIIYAPVGTAFIGPMHAFANRPKVWYVSSTELTGVEQALKAVKAGKLMRESRMAVIRGDKEERTKAEPLGTEIVTVPVKRYVEEFNKVSPDDKRVRALAEMYRRAARKIVEPKEQEIVHAARTYFAHRAVMAAYDADAVATDCLPLVANKQAPPPCLAFTHLRDEGFPAGCEADRDATLTLMLVQYLLDRPGFMGNPVPDTVRHTLITAHCTCPLKLNGFDAKPSPFILRSHAESDTGVAMQVLWGVGWRATVTRFLGPNNLMVGAGTVVGNLDTPPWGGCRTSVAVKLDDAPNIRKLRGFHHQVLVAGNHSEMLLCFAQLHGIAPLTITAALELLHNYYALDHTHGPEC
ncbi:MAG: L-arabinose isomerase family protein [Candidatus Fervidibacter sp.]|uniref:L-arabinose isomerase family protein n=1 Tax=Candidatus Fervidibacter sp. TaxID=3100871 RepID=UPI00404A85F2